LTALIAQKVGTKLDIPKIIVPVICILMIMLYFYAPIKDVSTWGVSIFALLSAILIFCFAQHPQAEPSSMLSKAMEWVGQRSYEMYLFHLIILGMFKVFYLPKETLPAEKLMLLPIYFMGVFILSWAIEKYYSAPLNRQIRQFLLNNR
jgi:peptidoglycan/LPS O-acetylase OafA/YrhL